MKLLRVTALIFLFVSCNNPGNNNGKAAKTQADSLMGEVMEGHNKGMAKMDKIDEEKKAIQHVLDSISLLPTNLQKRSDQYKMQLDSAFNRLTFANEAMDKWMNEFNMDTLKDNEQEQVKYLQSEKLKITKVTDAMIISLQKSDSLLKKK
ncbi:MAG: viral A-type inclusion protein [Chitinophagales bacterium]